LDIIRGGSAGFRTIMALERSAPPTTWRAFEVVWVNSSILARVPGPALLEEMQATISVYSESAARLMA